jgi:hypothetical protein
MKHYIVTYEDRLWLSFAHNPKEAIQQVIAQGVEGNWNDFKAQSVGSITNTIGKCVEFKVVDA